MDDPGQGNGDFNVSSSLNRPGMNSLYEPGVQLVLLDGPNIVGLYLFEKISLSHPESLVSDLLGLGPRRTC